MADGHLAVVDAGAQSGFSRTGAGDAEMDSEILNTLRRLERALEQIDGVVRGNNGEGLTARIARLDSVHGDHARRISEAEERVAGVERRVMWFAGAAAAVGALLPTLIGKWL